MPSGGYILLLTVICLSQLRVLGLGFVQDGDVGVGIFPQHQQNLDKRRGPWLRRLARNRLARSCRRAGTRACIREF